MAEIIQIDGNTWRIEDGFVRFFLLVGEEKAALIDSGVNCPNASDIAKKLTRTQPERGDHRRQLIVPALRRNAQQHLQVSASVYHFGFASAVAL